MRLVAGSLGSTLAFWREKTFQTLSITALVLVMWLGIWEGVSIGLGDVQVAGIDGRAWATMFSPFHAILAAAHPAMDIGTGTDWLNDEVTWFVLIALAATFVLNAIAIARVRVWNPSRDVRPGQIGQDEEASIWGVAHDLAQASGQQQEAAEQARASARGRAHAAGGGHEPPGVGQSDPVAGSVHVGLRPQSADHSRDVPAVVRDGLGRAALDGSSGAGGRTQGRVLDVPARRDRAAGAVRSGQSRGGQCLGGHIDHQRTGRPGARPAAGDRPFAARVRAWASWGA